MRAVIYARYSSDAQSAASIEDQLRTCKERITREGWRLVHVYRDAAMSGASALRPGYQALLECVRQAECEVIVTEAWDRLSRDQEDIAAFYKRCSFAGVRIVTLSDGEVSELHVGLRGTMNALFLKDLADKTRRGLRGRVEAGASGGGLTYGYDVVPSLETRGERWVNSTEADVIRRIFSAYRDGSSPKRIALELNQDGVAGPRGGKWAPTTINGNKDRGTGILNNELYVGRLVWNRLRYSKDPDTGRRRSRMNDAAMVVTKEVPDLRIIDNELWVAVRARQDRVSHREAIRSTPAPAGSPAWWSKHRPKYLFSGLMRCGICGGGFSKISKEHFGCSTARNKGPTACTNLISVRRDRLENTVLEGLRLRLMDPSIYQEFALAFTAEWNKLQAEASGDLTTRRSELARVKGQLEKLVDALCNGAAIASVQERMQVLDGRRQALEVELQNAVAPAPRLHPNLATVNREKVAALNDALDGADGLAAREMVRGLIEEVRLIPEDGSLRIELHGELASILGLVDGVKVSPETRKLTYPRADMALQVQVVAGTGFEPVTFRL
jgi:site-specific DNA recombinase